MTSNTVKTYWTIEVKQERYGWQRLPGEVMTRAEAEDIVRGQPNLRATRHEVAQMTTVTWSLEPWS